MALFTENTDYNFLEIKISGIYKIQNGIDGKCYIGSSRNVIERVMSHMYRCHNFHLRKAIREHGRQNFTFTILEVVTDFRMLAEREMFYINKFDSTNARKGYNIISDVTSADIDKNKRTITNRTSTTEDFFDFNRISSLPTRALVAGATVRLKRRK